MTEANGSFLIQPVKPGTYSIRIHFLGYDVYMGEEFILTEQIKDLGIIPMQMLEVGLQEVEVVANKKQVIYKLDKKIIEASSNLLSSGGTAVDILKRGITEAVRAPVGSVAIIWSLIRAMLLRITIIGIGMLSR